ncbi:MAG: PARP-type zinc finger-containing protein [Candidatus Thorarchaeota archaeon]
MTEWLEYTTDWGYWINPDTFRTPRIKKSIRVGSVVFLKSREILDDGRSIIVTTYGVAESSGLKEMGKKEASAILAKQMLEFMRFRKMYPPKTEIKKTYANGSVDIDYSPTDYDSFTIRLTPEMVGEDVEDFLYGLKPFTEEDFELAEAWRIEPAKSSRSTCRTCSKKIEKGELRLGEPSLFDGHVSYGWHHVKCAARLLKGSKLDSLVGYEELTGEQKEQLQKEV